MASSNPLGSLNSTLSGTSGTGLGQGIDVQQFVTFAVANQQAQITSLVAQQTNLAAQTSQISKISSDLSDLDNAVFAITNPLGVLSSKTATSSNSAIVNATASGGATSGSHSVVVNSLATTSSYYTDPLATSATTIAAGSFQLQVGTAAAINVTVDSTNNTLSQLADSINKQEIGISASVIQDANGYRLALVSGTSGAPGDITVLRKYDESGVQQAGDGNKCIVGSGRCAGQQREQYRE